ncbi:MAG: S9 family peptidase [Ignavibacterium sp.]
MKSIYRNIFLLLILLFQFQSFGQKKVFFVEDIYSKREFYGSSLRSVQWFDDGNKFSFIKYDSTSKSMAIFQYDVLTAEENVFLSSDELKIPNSDETVALMNYKWSPNEKYILFTDLLLARDIKSGGTFYIYDVINKNIISVIESDQEQMNAVFSPDGNKLAFVRGNNLYVIDIASGVEKQLTKDGSKEILNGHFDWVYEEEFSVIVGYDWSQDSKSIAFWRLDQSNVPKIKIAKWDSLYFNFLEMNYPKAGAKNSIVKIGVVNIENGNTQWMALGDETDIYIPRIKFTNDPNILSVQRLNRLQNKLEFLLYNVKSGRGDLLFSETDSAWVDVNDNLYFLQDNKRMIWTSERDGFNHLYFYDLKKKLVSQITKGNWEVNDLISVDEKNELIYFTANERGTIHKDLYSINFNGENLKRITELSGYHSINFSSNNGYFIDVYSNANSLPSTILCKSNGENMKAFITADMSVFKDYGFSQMEFLKFTTSDGVELNAAMIKPVDFDSTKKYPVLFYNYSGPGSQIVQDRWGSINHLWHEILAQRGFIIFMLDNRGTGGRGKAFKNLVYKNLGNWEVNDQIEGAKYLSTISYVDTARIGIWGWSYGGYMSALTLLKGADYFKVAVSVAPVTDWRFYDDIYTERFMSLPELNPEGYEKSSVLNYTDKLKGKLLLIHGTGDDNVHFQNSVALVKKLISENKQFQTMYYPEKDHGIYGGMTRIQLFNMITDFILKNL